MLPVVTVLLEDCPRREVFPSCDLAYPILGQWILPPRPKRLSMRVVIDR